jgi:competence ComEA-like helix-hairpin-helix protein
VKDVECGVESMAKTNLRTYQHDIETLINNGRYDEAISHCRHILSRYPKSVNVYRLLGKAFLEAHRYADAVDIFQRVLSAVPDDFVSHLGLSIIREDEGDLDRSIWHMERAYEIQPYNGAIQEELRRLFARRDGSAPPRIRLSKSALARMYAKGNLYQQAVAETRSALVKEPNRLDLQLLLANMYLKTGKKVEAAELSTKVLAKLPYCLDANRILLGVLRETERKDEAHIYQERLAALNPYEAFVNGDYAVADHVPDSTVLIDARELGVADLETANEPADWMTSLGLTTPEPETTLDEEMPDWLMAASAQVKTGELSKENEITAQESGVEDSLISEGDENIDLVEWLGSPTEPKASISIEPADELIEDDLPDWLIKPSDDLSTDIGETKSEKIEAAEIPDWLLELAPDEETYTRSETIEQSISEGADNDYPDIDNEDLVTKTGSLAASLSAFDELMQQKSGTIPEAQETKVETDLPGTPDDSKIQDRTTASENTDDVDFPVWLNEFNVVEDTDIQLEQPDAQRSETVPDWLRELEDEGITPQVDEFDETLLSPEEEISPQVKIEDEIYPQVTDESPGKTSKSADWMTTLDDNVDEEKTEEIEEKEHIPAAEFEEPPDFADADEALAWLASLAESQPEPIDEKLPNRTEEASDDQTDIEGDIAQEGRSNAPGSQDELEAPPDFDADDDTSAWLDGIASGSAEIKQTVISDYPTDSQSNDLDKPTIEDSPQIFEPESSYKPAGDFIKPINLNSASLIEIERIPGIGFEIAQKITSFRDKHGLFQTMEDLSAIPGLTAEDIQEFKDYVYIEQPVIQTTSPGERSERNKLVEARRAAASGDLKTAIPLYLELIKQNTFLDDVLFDLNQSIQEHPDNYELWQTLGDGYLRNNQMIEAMQAYNKAEELLG